MLRVLATLSMIAVWGLVASLVAVGATPTGVSAPTMRQISPPYHGNQARYGYDSSGIG